MDFKGQKLAEQLLLYILVISAAISFVVGYAVKDFGTMAKINGVGLLLAVITVLPDWPWYNRHPLTWLPPKLKPDDKEKKKAGWLSWLGL